MTTARQFPSYPIEVEFPDISQFAQGNIGIPYLYHFDSKEPGQHVMINAITHGNEVCGAIAVKELLELNVRPRKGKLTLAFANVDAYLKFDPSNPDSSRYVDQDLNRVWTQEILDNEALDSSELRRARELRPVIDDVDYLLDIHSMHERCAPLGVCGPTQKGLEFAISQQVPEWVIQDEGHPEGCRLRDYADFGRSDSPKNALLVECGQHWEAVSVDVARDSSARFLMSFNIIEQSDLPEHWVKPLEASHQKVVEVTEPVVATSMNFEFKNDYFGLETFAEKGIIIAEQDGFPISTPYSNCVLVMPSLRQLKPGVTVVRLGKLQETIERGEH
ncbi:M14 family metallopeptidase [Marinomonas mediterranea]|jgi:Succinylglutamate desuccinylase|uniref:Succinylglutamate desuccinylase/aspartoacylase n=1 Tax=Marinomonas mediterranea (strain ATCC 700492 / JCM 21426 / NBRC 103028 / MMB-1) TaxID=717774 RepID=F2JV33_MARM1|nr:M14 family metallopeptidase [Marinomonas mediterranea]ADZ91687.1 succinylglutamate desuccinylase/aspartoacylase [Marinomonas mediterranea MMB-1]